MAGFRRKKTGLTESQKHVLKENGVDPADGEVLSRIAPVVFTEGPDGKFTAFWDGKKVSVHKDFQGIVSGDQVWLCDMEIAGSHLCFAKPIRQISDSELLEYCEPKMEDIVRFVRAREIASENFGIGETYPGSRKKKKGKRKEGDEDDDWEEEEDLEENNKYVSVHYHSDFEKEELALKNRMLEKELELACKALDSKTMALEEMEKLRTESESNLRRANELSEENKILRHRLFDVISVRDGAEKVTRATSVSGGKNRESAHMVLSRLSDDDFFASTLHDGRYKVRINTDRTRIRLIRDNAGKVECEDGEFTIPGLGLIAPFNGRSELLCRNLGSGVFEVSL